MNRLVVILTLALALPSSARAAAGARIDGGPERSNNLRINPLGLLLGVANIAWDIGTSDRVTVGPAAAFTTRSANGVTATGYAFGVDTNFFLNHDRFTDSWILSPFAGYAHASSERGSASGVSIGTNIQYGWFYEGGFNLGLGGGVQYMSLDYSDVGLGNVSGLMPSITFTLGYAF